VIRAVYMSHMWLGMISIGQRPMQVNKVCESRLL